MYVSMDIDIVSKIFRASKSGLAYWTDHKSSGTATTDMS